MGVQVSQEERREFLTRAGVLALAAMPIAAAAAKNTGEHQHGEDPHAALVREALHCIETGNACSAHCINDMRSGSTELLECLVQVQELVIACEALAKLAINDSEHLKTYAAATIEVCETCEAECRKFEDKHPQCKDCAEACVACMEECQRTIA